MGTAVELLKRGDGLPKVKVWCAAIDCKHNKYNQCAAGEINLTDSYVHTLNDGLQHYNTCRNYEPCTEMKDFLRKIADMEVERRKKGLPPLTV